MSRLLDFGGVAIRQYKPRGQNLGGQFSKQRQMPGKGIYLYHEFATAFNSVEVEADDERLTPPDSQ